MSVATALQTTVVGIDAETSGVELLSSGNTAESPRAELVESIRRRVMAWTAWSAAPVARVQTSSEQRQMTNGGI